MSAKAIAGDGIGGLSGWVKDGLSLFSKDTSTAGRQVSSISRVSSNEVNKTFISEDAKAAGWSPPYPPDTSIRQITLGKEAQFLRVFSGDSPYGGFLVRSKEIESIINDPQAIKTYLGLKDMPSSIVDVFVPKGTVMNVGRIGSQPTFGLMESSGFQYQLLNRIPTESFQNVRPILQVNENLSYAYQP